MKVQQRRKAAAASCELSYCDRARSCSSMVLSSFSKADT